LTSRPGDAGWHECETQLNDHNQRRIEATAEAALGYDREAVSYGIGDAQHGQVTHGRRATAETLRVLSMGEAKRTTQHCIEPAETALGYDREAGYGIGDTAHARTGTRTSAWRRTLRVLMGEKRDHTTSKKTPQRQH
jgi:hypothetical protein